MIWEQNTRIIVMMTRLEERSRIKCDQYWPTRGTDTYPLLPNSNIQYPINKGHPNHLQHPLDEGKTKHSVGQQPGLRPQHDCLALTVTLVDSVNYAYYTMRTFHLQKMGLAGTVDRRTGGLANGCQLRSCSVKQQQGYDNYHRQSKHSDLQTESCQLNGVSPRIMDTLHGGPDGLVSVSEVREIRHFQFTAWPDNGAPDQSQPLLLFIRRINQTRVS
ncbi:unnamed protein product [Protopolystoma xenopodis]|uniref:Tyrosine-protein phosphatase domain-containing protein n=1 Tax=Protopolystoma xenopodis TaxID=117903 RepID=A0A448XJX6_9PLAT|nr:unnamed protein product [Protopolystoma xenopodis]